MLTVQSLPVKSTRNPNGVEATELVQGVLSDLAHERISYGHWRHSLMRQWILVQQCDWWFTQEQRSVKK